MKYFEGDIYLYLQNGEVIKCLDRKIKGYTDNISSSIYYLTVSEIEKLKNQNITSITFSISHIDNWGNKLSKTNHTAKNREDNTTIAIQALFLE